MKKTMLAHLKKRLGGKAAQLLALGLAWTATTAPATQAPPHKIAAANLDVLQNDTGNTINSVTVSASLSINDLRARTGSNRGDYNLQIGDTVTNDLAEGLVMVSISQNGRDNGELADEQKNYAAPAFDGNANGYWAVIQDTTDSRAEMNINCAVAYFPYNNFLAGWARNATASNGGTNNLFTASPGLVLGNSTALNTAYNLKWVKNGEFRVSLLNKGYSSTTNPGVLLVNHAKNEGNYASSVANADGTWEVYVKDNFANGTTLEQDPLAFVFVPATNTIVVSGKFGLDATGTNATTLIYSGNAPGFSVTNFQVGRYRLTIPGASPQAGVLMVSSEGGKTFNFDNTVSYEADGDGWIIEHRDLGVFPPLLEACTNEPVASFVYIPAATAGVSVSPTNTLVTSEFGLAASFDVQLDLAPTNDVTINFTSSNLAEGVLSTNFATFNATNWNLPQTVTITGQDDALTDGAVNYSIVLATIVSGDLRYHGLNPADVTVVNVDDETAGITVTPTSGLTTTEAGGTATFNVFLNRAPTDSVVIGLTSDNTAEGMLLTNSLTFTTTDWNVAQTVTVYGVDDFRKDANKSYKIITAAAVSGDLNYHGVNPADVSLVNLDNDNPGIIYNAASPVSVVEGGTTTYTVVLATQPDSNIVVNVSSGSNAVATVSPASLTFTPLDWSTPKVVTVAGVDNLIPDGSAAFSVINTVVANGDPLYTDFNGAKSLSAVRLDNETSLILPSGDCIYGLGMPAIGLDGQARIEDVDATTFNNGFLTVNILTNGHAADRLEIRNTGTNLNQISVSGAEVAYEGQVIGTYTGGINQASLVVALNTNSTRLAVQQLLRSVTFATPTNVSSLATRALTVTLDDGLGGHASTTKSVRVGALRQTQYQQGADNGYGDYFGAADIALSEVEPGVPFPAGRSLAEGLLIDWPDGGTPNESQVLLRFDDFVGTNYWQVPSNAIVVSAELFVHINNPGDGGRFHRMLIPWDGTNETWNTLGEGVAQDDVESRFIYESQLGVEDGSGATGEGTISLGVTPDIQAWVNGTNNFGWVIQGWPLRTDGTGFTPSEGAAIGDRPRLRVLWVMPEMQTVSFQQGVNGYTNALDTTLSQQNPDVNNVAGLSIGSDANDSGATNSTQTLLRFDNLIGTGTNQIPPGSLIHSAVLELASVGGDAMGDGGQFFALLQPWDAATTTWNTWTNGVQADGTEAALTATAAAGNAGLTPDVQGTINTYEVTADIQAWANGSRQNFGWAILPWPGGSNGWFSRSSKAVSLVEGRIPEAEHPRLRVTYTAGAIALPAVIQAPVVLPTQVLVNFTGTPNKTYTVYRAATLVGVWTSLGNALADANGVANFTDSAPLPSGAFYRVVYP